MPKLLWLQEIATTVGDVLEPVAAAPKGSLTPVVTPTGGSSGDTPTPLTTTTIDTHYRYFFAVHKVQPHPALVAILHPLSLWKFTKVFA